MKDHSKVSLAEEKLKKAGIKPTANRLLVIRELIDAKAPMSLIELETSLETMERSTISRVLNIFAEHHLIHTLEDGRGVSKYELCHGEHSCTVSDMHVHFYCEKCNATFCFEDIGAPHIELPAEFKIRSVNYMLKGLCPKCSRDTESPQ